MFSKRVSILFFIALVLVSCNPMGSQKTKVTFLNPGAFKNLSATVTAVSFQNNKLIINGTGLSKISSATLKNTHQTEVFKTESASDGQLIAVGLKNISIVVGGVFDLILSDAYGAATFQVSFTLNDGAVTASKLNSMGATSGQVLKFNGTNWAPASMSETQIYLGTWNANTNVPDLSVPSSTPGEYYVVTTGGTFSGVTYASGDWIISDGTSWSKIPFSNSMVTSFQGRKGVVTLQPSDYVSLKDGTTHKITGSSIADLADIDFTVAPSNGQVLKYNSGTSKWIPSSDNTAASGIALTDLSANSPLSYNNATGVFSLPSANLLALPLTGLSSGTGAVTATDSILGAFGKLMSVPSDYVSKSSGATIVSGTIAVGGTGMITVPTATGTTLTEVANVTYVNNAIAANGVWNKNASDISYSTGNVGIGTTTPVAKLDIVGAPSAWTSNNWKKAIKLETASGIQFTKGAISHFGIGSTNVGGIDTLLFFDTTADDNSSSANYRMALRSGNLGIGTTAPTEKLMVDGVVKSTGRLQVTGNAAPSSGAGTEVGYTGTYGYLLGYNRASSTYLPVALSGSDIRLMINDITKLQIDSSGNVGVGTSTPRTKLDVAGPIYQGNNFQQIFYMDAGSAWELGANRRYLKITTNIPFPLADDSMMDLFIRGSLYNDAKSIDMHLRWYNYSSSFWGASASSSGDATPTIKLANESGKICILLDAGASSRWYYSHLQIDGLIKNYSNISHYQNWVASEADLSGTATNVVTVPINSGNRYFAGNVGIGTSTPAEKLSIQNSVADATMRLSAGPSASYNADFNMGTDTRDWKIRASSSSGNYGLNFSYVGTDAPISNVLHLTKAGYVGIGTASPRKRVDIPGWWASTLLDGDNIAIRKPNYPSGAWARNLMQFEQYDGSVLTALGTYGDANNFYFGFIGPDFGSPTIAWTPAGKVGIGTSTPSTLLHAYTATAGATVATFQSGTGSCTVVPNAGMSCSSDQRLKENVEEIMNGLDRVLKLRGVTFKWRDRSPEDETRHIGFLAQEVEKVAPELVKVDSRGYKQVNYANFVAVLTSAIKEFFQRWLSDSNEIHREIASIKQKNAQLESDNLEMKKALCELGKKSFCR